MKADYFHFSRGISDFFVFNEDMELIYEGGSDGKIAVVRQKWDSKDVLKIPIDFKYWNEALPYFLQLMDIRGEIKLSQLINIFQAIVDEMILKMMCFDLLFRDNIENHEVKKFLVWLFGIEDPFVIERLKTNRDVLEYFKVYSARGTAWSLKKMIQLLFAMDSTIIEKVNVVSLYPQILFPFPVEAENVFEILLEKEILENKNKLVEMIRKFKPIDKIGILTVNINTEEKKVIKVIV